MQRYTSVVDVFCGVGGLTHGFILEGFNVVAGIDNDPSCKYAFEKNNGSKFIRADIAQLSSKEVSDLYPENTIKILIGCAPCQPFSTYTNKLKEKNQKQWALLEEFGRIIQEVQPIIVSMENVPSLGSKDVFNDFIDLLKKNCYHVTWKNVYCPDYGVPQKRWRLVLLASKLGGIKLISPTHRLDEYVTVEKAIRHLPPIVAGETYKGDALHRAGIMSDMNMKRIKSSVPGGTWKDWPKSLLAPCHRKKSGKSYYNVYGRMEWNKISSTITTQFTGFGNGRFGHPEQNRGLSLREGAILQTFPMTYEFFEPEKDYYSLTHVASHIGNAVPVGLARVIAKSIRFHLEDYDKETKRKISTPQPSSEAALRRMQAAKPRDTTPEVAIRSAIYQKGLRFRVDAKPLRELNRRADILFRSVKVAIFIDGCFWHGCPLHGTQAKANAEFWRVKIKQNRERDVDTTQRLKKAGWKVIRIWEHEDSNKASERIYNIIRKRQKTKK